MDTIRHLSNPVLRVTNSLLNITIVTGAMKTAAIVVATDMAAGAETAEAAGADLLEVLTLSGLAGHEELPIRPSYLLLVCEEPLYQSRALLSGFGAAMNCHLFE